MISMNNNKKEQKRVSKKRELERVTISIDKSILNGVEEIIKPYGGKISALINGLLKDFIKASKTPEEAKEDFKKRLLSERQKIDNYLKDLEGVKES